MFLLIALTIISGLVPGFEANDRPIIGVLVQEISQVFDMMYPGQYDTYIAASYVKWVESGGARVVPIWTGRSKDYYKKLMMKINGVLLPGGNVDKNEKDGYAEAAEHIVEIATELNKKKDYFPIFGIGLGMDFMLFLTNDGQEVAVDCRLEALTVSLVLGKKGAKQSALYNSSSDHIKRMMTSHPVSVLNSKKCYTKENFEKSKLDKFWIPFSYNYDQKGTMIVTSVEHSVFPFYGTLFHSEKIPFEWAENSNFPHTLATIEVSQYFSNYFVNEARKSSHKFANDKDALAHLIQNHPPKFTAKDGSKHFQTYLFRKLDEF